MTGVVKSNRCGTCRDRKVKCDEAKPVCGPCQKGKRICKDPISKVKFARFKGLAANVARQNDASKALVELLPQMDIVRSVSTIEGGSFQTLRIGRRRRAQEGLTKPRVSDHISLSRAPSLSSVESLQLVLVQSFSLAQPGLRLSVINNYMTEIPSMLGQSTALDDAVACLVNCHGHILHGQRPGDDIKQANLYAKALLSLQVALSDPIESYSDPTLGAVTTLANVELYGGGSNVPQNIQHAGGASKLIQMRGPVSCKSKFAKMLYMTHRGASTVVSMLLNEPCFFDRPEWRELSYTDVYDGDTDHVIDDIVRAFTSLPALLVKIRDFYDSPTEEASTTIYREATQIRERLQPSSVFVSETLNNGIDIIEAPSACGDTLVPTIYQYSSLAMANICTCYWGISLSIDTIIARFLPTNTPTFTLDDLHAQCLIARERILMSCEYTDQFRPLGAMYLSGPLTFAYRGATDEDKKWIMHRLWKIGELMSQPEVIWSTERLDYVSRYMLGEPSGFADGGGEVDLGARAFLKKRRGDFAEWVAERQG